MTPPGAMPKGFLQIFHSFIFLGGSGVCVFSPHLFWTSGLFCSSIMSTRHPYYFPRGKLDDSRTLLLLRRFVTISRHITLVVFRSFFTRNVLSKQCYTLEIVLLDYHPAVKKCPLCAIFIFFSRVSVLCKGRTVFIKEQRASVFKAASEALPVHVPTFRSHGNFKPALVGARCRLCAEDFWHSKTAVIRAEEEDGIGRGHGGHKRVHAQPAMLWFDDSWRVRGYGSIALQGWYPGGQKCPSVRTKND